jgi:hypothetical protein
VAGDRYSVVMWRLLGILLLVVACSRGSAGPRRLQPVAELPATLAQNGIEVTAQVNRVSTQLVVDTGAELTLLTAATVKSLLLARSQLTVSQLIGVEVPSAMPTSTRTCSWALQIFSVAS